MNPIPVACPSCHAPLAGTVVNTGAVSGCTWCGVLVRADIYPALVAGPAKGRPGDPLAVDSDSSCYFHVRSRAVAVCGRCGRFVCALCDMELGDRHLCPACLESGGETEPAVDLPARRVLYDNIALGLATYPILFFFVTFLSAPAALFIAIRYWNASPTLIRRTKVRNVAAILLALAQIAGWSWFLYSRLLASPPARQAFLGSFA